MEVVNFEYNGKVIEFLQGTDENVMVNATQMAKAFGKDLFQFTKSDNTKTFIRECLKPANAGFLGIEKEEDLLTSKQRAGTWMHRVLALKFAAWLDPAFELWVFATIEQILIGPYRELHAATLEKKQLEQKYAARKKELMETSPELRELFQMEIEIKQKKSWRIKAVRNTDQLNLGL